MSSPEAMMAADADFMKVPFESLKRDARDRKGLISGLQQAALKVAKLSADKKASPEQATAALSGLETELQQHITEHKRISQAELDSIRRCTARLRHQAELAPTAHQSCIAWNHQRLPRLIVDYLLREGHFESARALSSQCGADDLCEWPVFESAQVIVRALRAHDCGPALQWCAANTARLKKIPSKLPFLLRVQEYVELIKQRDTAAALAYARKHLAPFAADNLSEFKTALALLVFGPDSRCARYQSLRSDERWHVIADVFLADVLQTHNLSPIPMLEVLLQAGLTALKCPLSYEESCTKEDPMHLPELKTLAQDLPWAKHVSSKVVCSISQLVMDDSNPPVVLKNGYVYSRRAVEKMAAENGGTVTCPVTRDECSLHECLPAYIV